MGGGEIKERIHNSCRFSRVVWKTVIHRSSSIKKKKKKIRFMLYFYPEKSTKEWPTWKAVWSQVKSAWRNTYPVTLRLEDLFETSASLFFIYVCVCVQSFSYVWLFRDLRDCSPSGSSVHGILQARILGWVTISYFRGSSQPRDGTLVSFFSSIDRQILYHCTTWTVAYYWNIRGLLSRAYYWNIRGLS